MMYVVKEEYIKFKKILQFDESDFKNKYNKFFEEKIK